jgi:hypothetical protein
MSDLQIPSVSSAEDLGTCSDLPDNRSSRSDHSFPVSNHSSDFPYRSLIVSRISAPI